MTLVDTSVWVSFLNDEESLHAKRLLSLIEGRANLCLADIIVLEILQGIKDNDIFEHTKRYLSYFPIFRPKDVETFINAANIYRICRKMGKTIRKTIDCLIAAMTIENDLALFHNDRDFDSIAECTRLKVYRL